MESIKTVFVNYAVCALLGSIFEFISPRRSKETFRIISGVILLSVIVIPLAHLDFTEAIEELNFEYEELSEADSLVHTANLMEKELYNEIENILINHGVTEYEIYISTETDEKSKEIILTEVSIQVDEKFKDKIADIKSELKADFGKILKVGVKEND